MAAPAPSSALDRKSLIRAQLLTGVRADGRKPLELPRLGYAETTCSNPEDIIVTARVGETRVSCFLALTIKQSDPGSEEFIRIKFVGVDECEPMAGNTENDDDSDDEIEIDDGEERDSLNLQREAFLEGLFDEFEIVNQSRLNFLPNKTVFRLSITFHVLQDDGCVLDAAVLALMAALRRIRFPEVTYVEEEETVKYDWNNLASADDFSRPQFLSTFAVVDDILLASPLAEEEEVADAVIAAVVLESGQLGFSQVVDGMLAGRQTEFSGKLLTQMVDSARMRRKDYVGLLSQPPTEDVLIPEERAHRLRTFRLPL